MQKKEVISEPLPTASAPVFRHTSIAKTHYLLVRICVHGSDRFFFIVGSNKLTYLPFGVGHLPFASALAEEVSVRVRACVYGGGCKTNRPAERRSVVI